MSWFDASKAPGTQRSLAYSLLLQMGREEKQKKLEIRLERKHSMGKTGSNLKDIKKKKSLTELKEDNEN